MDILTGNQLSVLLPAAVFTKLAGEAATLDAYSLSDDGVYFYCLRIVSRFIGIAPRPKSMFIIKRVIYSEFYKVGIK